MENQYYLRIENDNFGFLVDGIHKIQETDIPISYEDYTTFFNYQSEGKQFKLKEIPTGSGLFDYIEEYTPEVIVDNTPTTEDRLKALEMAMLEVL